MFNLLLLRLHFLFSRIYTHILLASGRIVGRACRVDCGTLIKTHCKGQLVLGHGVVLRSLRTGYHAGMPFPCTVLVDFPDAKVVIGDNSRINGVYIHSQKYIEIGRNCVIAAGVNILDANGHEIYSVDRTIGRDKPESIFVGDNVWIGINAVILKGTVIGKNSVVGANSVVSGTFPENSLIVGNPACVVKELGFDRKK